MTDDQQELVCARCRRPVCTDTEKKHGSPKVLKRKWWPEGAICVKCYAHALDTYGVCAGCAVDRLLPGLSDTGAAVCTDCAGGLGDFSCPRCGREGHRWTKSACARCILTDQLTVVFDDGAGSIRPALLPLYTSLCAMSRARTGLTWLRKPHVAAILGALARGEVPLTHAGPDHPATLAIRRLHPRPAHGVRHAAARRPVPADVRAMAARVAGHGR